MNQFKTSINGKEVIFENDRLIYAGHSIPYNKMSNIAHRNSEPPAFTFDYAGKHLALPYNINEKNSILPFFQHAAALDQQKNMTAQDEFEDTEAENNVYTYGFTTSQNSPQRFIANDKQEKQKKPIYKRKWFIAIVVIFALGAIGAIVGENDLLTDQASTTEASSENISAKDEIEKLEGKTCYDAEQILNELGYNGIYTFETNGLDFTGEVDAMDPENQKTFIITKVGDIDESSKEASFIINSLSNKEKEANEDSLRERLSEGSSCVAIEDYGKGEYPYGFDFSSFSAKFTLKDDNTWHVSGNCTVTNEYGVEAKMQCIAEVTGTTGNPEVIYFEVR